MARHCINHPEIEAALMCHQCHKPICSDCTIIGATGSFCSAECNLQNVTFRSKQAASGPRHRLGVIGWTVAVVLLVIATLVIIHFGARSVPALKGIDLIGNLIDGVRNFFLK